ncbi:Tn3 family transposase [Streptomyces sp. HM190]|uniref:Tn3 family transposase n=1 Tax=Streptomyces sp. HM190 TaxID=2695266 RepID=UPI001916DA0D|nr:Tn3 family transposase [Streptomyces sp. HM190]
MVRAGTGHVGPALGPTLGAIAPRGTRSLDAAVARLRTEGHDIEDEDVAHLPPSEDRHVDFLGRHPFTIRAGGPGQGLRPFRNPEAAEDDEDRRRHTLPAGPPQRPLMVAPAWAG